MIAAVMFLFLEPDQAIDAILRLAASEPVEYSIDTRLKLAEAIVQKYPDRAKRQLRDAEASLSGIQDAGVQNTWRVRLVGAFAPLDFEEADRLTRSIGSDRKNDRLAQGYDLLYANLRGRDQDEFIVEAIRAGAFRLQCASQRLSALKVSSPPLATALLEALLHSFPDSPDKRDIDYLEERANEMQAVDSETASRALKKVHSAAAIAKKQTAAPKPEVKDDAEDQPPDFSKLPSADATERVPKLASAAARASAIIDLSRREGLTRQQQARLAAEALSAVGQMKLGEDRLIGLAMLSRDFAKRHEPASAALAAQMLSESFTKMCQCGPQCDAGHGPEPETDCVSLVNDFAEYLDEMNFTQESFGLNNISLEARLLILKLKKQVTVPSSSP